MSSIPTTALNGNSDTDATPHPAGVHAHRWRRPRDESPHGTAADVLASGSRRSQWRDRPGLGRRRGRPHRCSSASVADDALTRPGVEGRPAAAWQSCRHGHDRGVRGASSGGRGRSVLCRGGWQRYRLGAVARPARRSRGAGRARAGRQDDDRGPRRIGRRTRRGTGVRVDSLSRPRLTRAWRPPSARQCWRRWCPMSARMRSAGGPSTAARSQCAGPSPPLAPLRLPPRRLPASSRAYSAR